LHSICLPCPLISLSVLVCFIMLSPPPTSLVFPYTTLFRSVSERVQNYSGGKQKIGNKNKQPSRNKFAGNKRRNEEQEKMRRLQLDRKSTRLNSSHVSISYAVFCLKKKNTNRETIYVFK